MTVLVKSPSGVGAELVEQPAGLRVAGMAVRRGVGRHCASPSTAFGVKPEPWTVTCSPSAYGPVGVVLISVGGGATAVGSKPSGTSFTASGSSTDCDAHDAFADRLRAVRGVGDDDDAVVVRQRAVDAQDGVDRLRWRPR